MNRRGFFGRLFGKRETRKSCFAIQVVINAYGDEELRKKLHEIMASGNDDEESPLEKRRYYKRLCAVLLEAEPYFEYASFSYEDDEDAAQDEFDEWVYEIEGEIATEPEEMGDEVDGYNRMSSEKRYVVFTMIFLLAGPHPYGDKYDDENVDDYTRKNIADLIDSVSFFDFNDVIADANYLMPGNETDGFSSMDLMDEGWGHLKMLKSG